MDNFEKISNKKYKIIDENEINEGAYSKIYDIINANKGDKPVFMRIDNGTHKITFKFKNETTHSVEKVIKQLIELENSNVSR